MITSKTNEHIRLLDKLINQKKYRQQYNMYVLEGEKLLLEAVRFGKQIHSIYLSDKSKVELPDNLQSLVTFVSDNVLQSITPTVNGQGVLCVVKKDKDDILTTTGDALVLDGLQDPGNMGTILRSAVAFGFCDVYCCNCVDVYSPKVLRSAMSAHFALKLHIVADVQQAFEALGDNYVTICADMNGQSIDNYVRSDKKIAIVLGNEGNGLSEFSRQNANITLALPMQNNLESLNVAVAGSIMMYLLQTKA